MPPPTTGPCVRSRASWQPILRCGSGWSLCWSRTGRRSRSRRGFTCSTRMCRRCGCRTRRSTATCTCRHGRCSTRACSTGCAVSVRSAARAARCPPTGAGASGTWFPSTPARSRPMTVRSPGTGGRSGVWGPPVGGRDVGRPGDPLHDGHPPARRVQGRHGRRRSGGADGHPAHRAAQVADLGPWSGDGRPRHHHSGVVDAGVLLRPAPPLAARHEREPNRLLRQYLHKKADLSALTQDYLDAIASKFNHRPAGCSAGPPPPRRQRPSGCLSRAGCGSGSHAPAW